MEHFEDQALEVASYKPKLYKQFVHATFLIWPHGFKKLHKFVSYLNVVYDTIKFTMEIRGKWEVGWHTGACSIEESNPHKSF